MQRRVQSGKLRQCTFRRAFEKRYLRLRIRINAFSGVSCCARCRTCAEAGSCCRSGRFGTLRSDCQARGNNRAFKPAVTLNPAARVRITLDRNPDPHKKLQLSQPNQTLDRFWDLPQRDLLELLEATPAGLTSAEAKQRLHLHGPNSLAGESRFAPLMAFVRFFANPLVLVLLMASAITIVLGDLAGGSIIIIITMSIRTCCTSPNDGKSGSFASL
jgi:hypothetical protein